MRAVAAVAMLALLGTAVRVGIAGVTPSAQPAAPAPAAPEAAPSADPVAPPPDLGPAPPPPIRELSTAVPADVKIEVVPEGDEAVRVRVRRAGHLVALRRLDARNAASDLASLRVLRRELTDAALVWETTRLDARDGFETTRGVLRLDAEGEPRARLAEAPAATPLEARRRHTCWSHADGFGGSTVLCRITAFASAANVTGERRGDDAWAIASAERSLVRLDLPARPEGVEARVIGYLDGRTAVVIRAESSLVPGEARPSLTVLSAEREQRLPPPIRSFHHRHPFDEIDL